MEAGKVVLLPLLPPPPELPPVLPPVLPLFVVVTMDSLEAGLTFPDESKAVAMNPYFSPGRRFVMVVCGADGLDGSPEKTAAP